jgi:hypothetical protein
VLLLRCGFLGLSTAFLFSLDDIFEWFVRVDIEVRERPDLL